MGACVRLVCSSSRSFIFIQRLCLSTQKFRLFPVAKETSRNNEPFTVSKLLCSQFHSSVVNRDLMEFFDDKNNWGAEEVRTGRSWRKEELRIKSNSDLHKLWYVLLKELNMLLTMEYEYKRECETFPNPERIDKVKESMYNLEQVVRERNRAYYELETGHDGERPTQLVENVLGMHKFYRLSEYPLPHQMNTQWQKDYLFNHWDPLHVNEFKKLMREKAVKEKQRAKGRIVNHVKGLIKKFPHLSDELLSEHYPDVDVARIRWKIS